MRKRVIAVVLAVMVFSLIAASAASLGGINVADVGADTTIVASCDNDGSGVTADYGFGYSAALGEYEITSVTISGINDACLDAGHQISITLANSDSSITLGMGPQAIADNGTTDNDTSTFALAAGSFAADDLELLAVVIG